MQAIEVGRQATRTFYCYLDRRTYVNAQSARETAAYVDAESKGYDS